VFVAALQTPQPTTPPLRSRVARFFLVQLTKMGKIIPNDRKIYQMATKYTKWPQTIPNGSKIDQMAIDVPTSSFGRPSKIFPNWDFLV
jgi:hypothetical protein